MPKVFCIGFNKTATSSVLQAFRILGLGPAASPKTLPGDQSLTRCALEGDFRPLVEAARPYRCFKDRPWNVGDCYKAMDQAFPGSRFVLTVRDEDAWWRSVQSWLVNVKPHLLQLYFRHLKVGELTREAFVGGLRRRDAEIRAHFTGRDALLELDPSSDHAWADLCGFLGTPVPEGPFPHTNRQTYLPVSPESPRVHRFDAGGA